MAAVRRPAVAGAFYDADPASLRRTVARHLDAAAIPTVDVSVRALIVPHAGHVYSGPIAAVAYRLLGRPTRIVLVGPSHFAPFRGVAMPEATTFETPLGSVPIDPALAPVAAAAHVVVTSDGAHSREHSLEVQLPFIQCLLGDFTMLPLLTGDVSPNEVADLLAELVEDDVFLIVSSDLSHYLHYDTARRRDEATAAAIVALRPEELEWGDACGRTGVQAALSLARRRGWECRLLDLRNSGDTAGGRARVVGYGAFALGPGS